MRKLVLALAAIAAVGIAVPVASSQADAKTIIIKRGGGHHHGMMHRGHAKKVIIVKRGHGRMHRH